MKSQALYSYAYDSSGILINISNIKKGNSGDTYTCVGCGSPLIPKMGNKRIYHFSHKTYSCSSESYIHKLAKEIIRNSFIHSLQNHLPFKMEYKRPVICTIEGCEDRTANGYFDLAKIFDTVALEVPYKGYVMDILLSSSTSDRVLAIEIMNTHKCSIDKTSSGIPIIELTIQNENQLGIFYQYPIHIKSYHSFNLKHHKPLIVETYSCPSCPGSDLFYVNYSRKAFLLHNYRGYNVQFPLSVPIFTKDFGLTNNLEYVNRFFEGILLALESGIEIKWRPSSGSVFNKFITWLIDKGERGKIAADKLGYTDYITELNNKREFNRLMVKSENEAFLLHVSKKRIPVLHR